MKKCPYCAESIQEEAIKCRFCDEFLNSSESNKIEVVRMVVVSKNHDRSFSDYWDEIKNGYSDLLYIHGWLEEHTKGSPGGATIKIEKHYYYRITGYDQYTPQEIIALKSGIDIIDDSDYLNLDNCVIDMTVEEFMKKKEEMDKINPTRSTFSI